MSIIKQNSLKVWFCTQGSAKSRTCWMTGGALCLFKRYRDKHWIFLPCKSVFVRPSSELHLCEAPAPKTHLAPQILHHMRGFRALSCVARFYGLAFPQIYQWKGPCVNTGCDFYQMETSVLTEQQQEVLVNWGIWGCSWQFLTLMVPDQSFVGHCLLATGTKQLWALKDLSPHNHHPLLKVASSVHQYVQVHK